jgi:hypothetical protein
MPQTPVQVREIGYPLPETVDKLTVRDFFAAKAMVVYLGLPGTSDEKVATWAYATADEMMKERAK